MRKLENLGLGFVLLLMISFPIALVIALCYSFNEIEVEKKEMISYIGKRIVVEKDTLLVTDKSWWSKTLQLSNGKDIDFELGKKLIISSK